MFLFRLQKLNAHKIQEERTDPAYRHCILFDTRFIQYQHISTLKKPHRGCRFHLTYMFSIHIYYLIYKDERMCVGMLSRNCPRWTRIKN